METRRVAVAMSGGVDSACAALLLRDAGCQVCGVTLRLRECGEGCGSDAELDAARAAADSMGIPHTVLDRRELFGRAVEDRFVAEYAAGRTPNPCVDCNRAVKFGALLDWALEQGFDALATGHYARVEREPDTGRWQLLRGVDPRKDQSYFLCQIRPEALPRLLFPLGGYEKPAVRTLAAARGIASAHRPDSQDICFVPDGDYAAFLAARGVPLEPGDFVDQAGRVLGRHRGLARYTPGQRRGLGISASEPLYVLGKNSAHNTVMLGPERDLFSRTLTAERMNWLSFPEPAGPVRVEARTRYSQRLAAATARPLPGGRLELTFDEPQRAVTPGQTVALYIGEAVAAGGTIC